MKASKVWKLLFPPKCFGNDFEVAKCITNYWKERNPKGLKPKCPVHDECITVSIRREVARTLAKGQRK